MNRQTFNKILQINKDFYECVAEEFDTSRQYAWKGWEQVLKEINAYITETGLESIRVLDLGCGNGRFYKFLTENLEIKIEYVGIDNNEALLEKARDIKVRIRDRVDFIFGDVLTSLNEVLNGLDETYNYNSFDLVVAFGITHHIPDVEFRKEWATKVLDLSCYMTVLTFWNPTDTKQFRPLAKGEIAKILKINPSELDDSDYFLIWGNDNYTTNTNRNTCEEDCIRYVHIWKENEINEINKNSKLFYADGKGNNLNIYQISLKSLDL